MDFLFVVGNWVRAKAAGKLENKQTMGEGMWGGGGGRQKEYFHFSSSWTLKYTVRIPCFFSRIVKIKRSPSLAAIL